MNVGYREGGRGPNLVLVMGRTGTMADWDPALLGRLIFGHHLVVFDNRGVATTDNPSSASLTVARMAEDAGHAFLFEYPFAVGRAIRRFLR